MACMGFDVGYQSCVAAVPKAGGIEVTLNDYSQRQTPSFVSFGGQMRALGESGKQKAVTSFKNTISYFKCLLGRQYNSPDVQAELAKSFYKHVPMPDGTVGVEVDHAGERIVLSMTQVMAMLLAHVHSCAEKDAQLKIDSCVVSVPVYFNDAQRHAMLEACKIANLDCLRLMNETTAVALGYGIYKQDLPAANEPPRRVVFVDFGHSCMQLSLCEFVKGKLTVLSTASCPVGGRDFDLAILNEMAKRFQEKTKLDFRTKPRCFIRMETECEKLKKMMSANATDIPMNVECLMDEKDFSTSMNRAEFEELCAPIFSQIQTTIHSFVQEFEKRDIKVSDLHSVEIVGGSSRVPLVKQMLSEAFGTQLHTTMNCDEAVARGCALMSAIMSPIYRVRDFKVEENAPYAINLHWPAANPGEPDNTSEIFLKNSSSSVTKLLTFYRKQDFEFTATYANADEVPDSPALIGSFRVEGVKPSFEDAAQKVKVEIQMDSNGCLIVPSATLLDKLPPAPEAEEAPKTDNQMDTSEDKPEEKSDAGTTSPGDDKATKPEAPTENADAGKAAENDKKKSKKTHKKVNLTVVTSKPCLKTDKEINELVEVQGKLTVQDLHEKEKNDARNALEEYIYDMRDKLGGIYEEFIAPDDGDAFRSKLTSMEDWLYEDGEDQPKTVYVEKLQDLRATGDGVKSRATDWELRPDAEKKLRHTIMLYRKFLDEQAAGDEKYNHLTEEDVKKVADQVNSTEQWLNAKVNEQNSLPKYSTPVLTVTDLENKAAEVERICKPVVNKPKPKVEPPKDEPKPAEPEQPQSTPQEGEASTEQPQQAEQTTDAPQDNVMDTD
eukprot:m.7703 g.7703  ORF g.7703 m.7703 type:complete len:834 (-) comp5280_c0_seq1:41-2542(-)